MLEWPMPGQAAPRYRVQLQHSGTCCCERASWMIPAGIPPGALWHRAHSARGCVTACEAGLRCVEGCCWAAEGYGCTVPGDPGGGGDGTAELGSGAADLRGGGRGGAGAAGDWLRDSGTAELSGGGRGGGGQAK
ncbi:uncharacterized PE-PGRS family protein PE_PGRS54-like [Corvus hawaiiensis]|uniref:uncharacterized PE-PGRS family protein PE_PGRS54-like n=1 Tax=Corvus hawaiiensis TaxID=134902 RepID=UPI00201956E5|nr:uncharacterized PE-PGRS family protein PE_PGRS54-like [Corvus hawaiiensis]